MPHPTSVATESAPSAPVCPQVSEPGEHVLPVKTYLVIYGALIALTYLTVQVSLFDLGATSIYVAMIVATIKASLVVGYFMHLKFDTRFNSVVFLSSLLFLAIFFVLTMVDLGSRDSVLDEEGNEALRRDKAAAPGSGLTPPAQSK